MPKIKSAKKELRKSKKRNERNVAQKNALKKLIKSYRKLLEAKKAGEAKALLPKVYKALDKGAKTNLIKRNKASRLKSRLSGLLSKAI